MLSFRDQVVNISVKIFTLLHGKKEQEHVCLVCLWKRNRILNLFQYGRRFLVSSSENLFSYMLSSSINSCLCMPQMHCTISMTDPQARLLILKMLLPQINCRIFPRRREDAFAPSCNISGRTELCFKAFFSASPYVFITGF